MKRKLNDLNAPAPVTEASAKAKPNFAFETLGLDTRLLQSIAKEGFSDPTLVQEQVIPLALQGKDVLACSKTGSGKTLAYVLPVLEDILRRKADNSTLKAVSALILVPTKELAEQVSKVVILFSSYCTRDVRCLNLAQNTSDTVQRSLLSDSPDIIVSTPSRVWAHSRNAALDLTTVSYLVIDEADLVVSYGYEEDLQKVASAIPSRAQKVLMSATVSEDVETLKTLFCKDPAVLTLEEKEKDNPISQFIVRCGEDEKFLLLYVIVKLKLIKGKSIIFVGDIDRSYRLKLYLEQFGTRSCVLNSELPVNSRIHVVEEFNKNVYDIIIASDEHEVLGPKSRPKYQKELADLDDDATANGQGAESPSADEHTRSRKRKVAKKAKEYGVSRGIDFRNVACVLNFDLPTSSKSYTHRIGRTGRAGKSGMALSFVVPKTLYRKHKGTSFPSAEHDEEVLEEISETQTKKGNEVQDYHFDMKQVDAFRYRMEAALRAVSSKAVREARTRELRQELINSDKLKRHFEENPDDLRHLRHDGELRAAKIQAHLKHVPDYLLPNPGGKAISSGDIGFVGLGKVGENRRGKFRRGKGKKPGGRRNDPLKTFNARGRKKK